MSVVKPEVEGYKSMGSVDTGQQESDLPKTANSTVRSAGPSNLTMRKDWRSRKSSSTIEQLGLNTYPRGQNDDVDNSSIPRQWSGTSPRGIEASGRRAGPKAKTVHHLSEELYSRFATRKLPHFFSHIKIDPDGGLDRLAELWHPDRIMWFVFLLASAGFNVCVLCHANWSVFESLVRDLMHGEGIDQGVKTDEKGLSAIDVRHIQVGGAAAQQAIAKGYSSDMFHYIAPRVRMRVMSIAVAISCFEMIGLFTFVLNLMMQFYTFNFAKSKYKQFKAVTHLFSTSLPNFSTFSAIKLFSYVHPSLVYTMYLDFMRESDLARQGGSGYCLAFSWFLISRIGCAIFSVLAFAIKLLAAAFKLAHPEAGWWLSWFYVIALMNQCMGVVLIEQVLQDRLFLFIFGGSDAFFQDEERALYHVYHVRLAEGIWDRYWKEGQKWKCVCLLATLDHYDLQGLILEDGDKSVADEVERGDGPIEIM